MANEFDPYVGTWKAVYNGNTIELQLVKELHTPIVYEQDFYTDRITGRFRIEDASGQTIFSTFGKDFTQDRKHNLRGLRLFENGQMMRLIYSGGDCSVGIGMIIINKLDANYLKWNYQAGGMTISEQTCPPPRDLTIYLPEVSDLIFTKQ